MFYSEISHNRKCFVGFKKFFSTVLKEYKL